MEPNSFVRRQLKYSTYKIELENNFFLEVYKTIAASIFAVWEQFLTILGHQYAHLGQIWAENYTNLAKKLLPLTS